MIDSIARALIRPEKASLEPQKAVTGPGAAVMTWGTPLSDVIRTSQTMMRDAQAVYSRGNRWVKRAEMTISGRVGSVPWHLETDDGETINDESSPELRRIRDVFEKPLGGEEFSRQYPNQAKTRRELWGLTSRHMGLCNVGFWYLDGIDATTQFPTRIYLLRPDRLTPNENDSGGLKSWQLDKGDEGGTELSLVEVLPFYLDPPDRGYFGTGLVESILSTLNLPSAIDRHAIDTLGSGGRLPGIYAPKENTNDDVFDRLTNDLRTIKDMPDSSKRDVVARAPIEFTPTAADMSSLVVTALSQMSRDDTLTHWGTPLSVIGGTGPSGLNSGESRNSASPACARPSSTSCSIASRSSA
jgi:phage portal protein BeeE